MIVPRTLPFLHNLLQILLMNPEYYQNAAYIIMARLGVINTTQLLIHFYTGILLMAQWQMPFLLNKVKSGGYFPLTSLTHTFMRKIICKQEVFAPSRKNNFRCFRP